MWTPVGEGAGSSHCCAAREPWCADAVSATEPQAIAQSAPDTGTAARTTNATTLTRCFQPTVRVYPRCVGSAATLGVGAAHYSWTLPIPEAELKVIAALVQFNYTQSSMSSAPWPIIRLCLFV